MIKETEHFILDYIVGKDYFGGEGYFPPEEGLNIYLKEDNGKRGDTIVIIRPAYCYTVEIKKLPGSLNEAVANNAAQKELDDLIADAKLSLETTLAIKMGQDFIGD